ncbi:MAG TPA: Asp-tRNA(Asn)/Glu-tRNA(Gln) amidotransferase subunit GatC [Gemmatirosa sp.]
MAALARLGLDEERLPSLVAELNGILVHMDALQRVKTGGEPVAGISSGGMPLRDDAGPQYPLAHPRTQFAPAMRSGFFLVPRLATHAALAASEGDVDSSVDDAADADALVADPAALDATDA